jgi:glycosyltransferase involved in cell wall biosynthesis
MRVLFIVGRELEYPRNDVLLRAFQRFSQVDVLGARERPGSLFLNSLEISLKALPKVLFSRYDHIFVGFYGHLLMLPVGTLARTPILFDAFLSTYDTLCFDRKIFPPDSIRGRFAFWLDRTACQMANQVLLDTPQHIDYFVDTFNLSREKISSLPVGCNEDLFYPKHHINNNEFQVLYYTTYLPIHGVDVVIQAAALLKNDKHIRIRLIGNGIGYRRIRQIAEENKINNVDFLPSIPLTQLPDKIAHADLCLGGHFQNSEKASRVIPGKIYQMLAMARPVVASDSPANRSLLTHEETAYLCSPADPESLADAILTLSQDVKMNEALARNGRLLYEKTCSERVITHTLMNILQIDPGINS